MIEMVAVVFCAGAAWGAWRQRLAVERESRRMRRWYRQGGRWS